ncbi:MAG: hypothetical protein WD226_03060 [Planctomycetota bacterium]
MTLRLFVFIALSWFGTLIGFAGAPAAQTGNSGVKLRSEPSALAERAGSAVAWLTDLDSALRESATQGRPVFWYVPTLERSYVDREVELDRKMRAGPFSWPRLIELLNTRYVPLRLAVDEGLEERFDLDRRNFLAPGFLVLTGEGELSRFDQITTHHPNWYLARLAPESATPEAYEPQPRITRRAEPEFAEALFLGGVDSSPAVRERLWRRLMDEHRDHPLAWKAAMELEGHGPLLRGQESYTPLPLAALDGGVGTRVARPLYGVQQLFERGARVLMKLQEPDGALRDSIYDFGGTDSLPSVYAAVSALAAHALFVAEPRVVPLGQACAAERALEHAIGVALMPNDDLDERVWPLVYALRALVAYEARGSSPERFGEGTAQRLVDALVAEQLDTGAWRHEYANPFVTADALLALWDARTLGLDVPASSVEQGVRALLLSRSRVGGYTYMQAGPGRSPVAAMEASVGRAPKCELALHRWAPGECRGLERTIALSFEHEGPLLAVQKLDDHGPRFGYGGFFFWYDLHARTEAIAALPSGRVRDLYRERQLEQLLGLPEIDGAFVDSHELGRGYGTAMALACLGLLEKLETGRGRR